MVTALTATPQDAALTPTEQRHVTARSRAEARTARTVERRRARRVKYAPQPFNAAALMRELNAEGAAQ